MEQTRTKAELVLLLSLNSLLATMLYLLLDASDVALTEAVIGASLSNIIFWLFLRHEAKVGGGKVAIYELGLEEASSQQRFYGIISGLVVFAVCVWLMDYLPEFGTYDAPIHQSHTGYYGAHAKAEIGVESEVAAILASYRALDTLFETVVILVAGIASKSILD